MPKRQTRVLSDPQLRGLIAMGQAAALSDGDGLTFTLSAAGTAVWVLRYRHGGRRKEVTLGRYPDLSLSEARKRAAVQRVQVDAGKDVAIEKRRERADRKTAWTVRTLARDFEAKVLPVLAPSTAFCTWNYIQTDVLSRFGSFIARDVTADDVQDWLEQLMRERGYWPAANARKAAAHLYRHGRAARVTHGNPFTDVSMSAVAPRPRVRARVALSDDELRAVLQTGLATMQPRDAALVELLLLTGVRIGEALSAEWVDVARDAAEWRIPRAKIKTRKGMKSNVFVVPLPPAGVALFDRLRELAGGSRWVFPASAGFAPDLRPMDHERSLDRFKASIAGLGETCRAVTFHDLRSTMRSHLIVLGVQTEVAERALNHQLGGLLDVYDRGDYLPQRRDALNRWSGKLEALRAGGNVVPMQRKPAA